MDTSGMTVTADDTPDDPYTITIKGDGPYESDSELDKIASGKRDMFHKSGDKLRKVDGLTDTTKRRMYRQIRKAKGEEGAESKKQEEKIPSGYALFDVVEPPYNMEYLAKLYEISAPWRAAVDAKVTNTVGLGFDFIESPRTQEKVARITDEAKLERARRKIARAKRDLHEWVERTNNEETFDEVLRKVMTDYETLGNGYIEIARGANGRIGYIGHIPATSMRRRVQKDGYVQLVANRANFFRNFGDSKTANPIGNDNNPSEVIHLMKYTPTNSFYGVPDILAAKNALAGDEFASRFNLDYFEHKAVPRYIVTLKGAQLDSQSEKRIINFLSSNLKGQHHRTLYIPLPPDQANTKVEFKMEAVEAKVQEASFVKYREMNRDEILMAARVPMPQTGATANISLGASRDSAKMFKEQVCRPVQEVVEKRFKPVFSEITDAFIFHLVELTLTDEDTASRIHERYLRWDVYTPNDVLEWLGNKGRPGGDDTVGVMSQAKLKADTSQTTANANASRQQDSERSGGPDTDGSDRTRNPKGEGRQTE